MATRTIETKAIISAEDRTGQAFAAVVQHMARMEDAARKAKTRMAEVTADKYLAGGQGRVERINQEHAASRRVLVENRSARREELAHYREIERLENRRAARRTALGIGGAFAAHETAHFAHRSLETYREFDKERRFGRAVMGISDDDQAALVRQAIHMGATTKFNDIQVLEAQRELAARGLNKEQILGMMGAAGDLGQSLDLTLPDAVKQMEGAIFGFKKNIGTTADAMASARQTADIQVRAAKMSGMTPDDIKETYKYGATPARLSGVSEQLLLAFGGISKKANMGGSEAGTAFRALMATGNAPTRGAKEAMLANGLDYSKYQKKIDHIDVEPFARNVAAQYGVTLNKTALGALTKVFSDPKVLNDPALFTPAVTGVLGDALHGKDAKSLKSIAGMANRFRNASGGGADINAFLTDLMIKMGDGKSGIALTNAIFGSKQGSRIANAIGDPETFKAMIALLRDHSEGYAKNVSDQRMGGFDGAVSRLEGAIKNLESALPRAFDADGKGGMLTNVSDMAGKFIQTLAEAPPQLQRLGVEAGLVAGAFAGIKGAEAILGGFGLKATAGLLDHSAGMLEAAAIKLGATGKLSDLPSAGVASKGRSRFMKVVNTIPIVATAAAVVGEGVSILQDWHEQEFGPDGPRAPTNKLRGPSMGGNAHRASFNAPRGSLLSGGFAPIGGGGELPAFAQKPAKVDVSFGKPATVVVEVQAASALIAIVNKLQSITLKPTADTGPGGLGETGTGQH